MILVAGATGLVGGETAKLLARHGQEVRALVRPSADPARVDALRERGVEVVAGDLTRPDTLVPALQGVQTVIATASALSSPGAGNTLQTVDRDGQIALIRAAEEAGVQHVIYLSLSAGMHTPSPLLEAKRAMEQRLQAGSLTYTILRPSYLMELWLGPALGFDVRNASAQIYGSGRNPVSYVSYANVAQFAADAVRNPAARDATFEIGGPRALSQLDAVHLAQHITGQEFLITQIPRDNLLAGLQSDDPVRKSFAALTLDYADGDVVEMTETLTLFPMHLTDVEEYFRGVMAPH